MFHELTYNRRNGEPNWLYASGRFHGNKLTGVAYHITWLSPSEGGSLGWRVDSNGYLDPYVRMAQPTRNELLFEPTSSGIIVWGVNHISAFVGVHNVDGDLQPVYRHYRRWIFAVLHTSERNRKKAGKYK